jgi:hypothetical protein
MINNNIKSPWKIIRKELILSIALLIAPFITLIALNPGKAYSQVNINSTIIQTAIEKSFLIDGGEVYKLTDENLNSYIYNSIFLGNSL